MTGWLGIDAYKTDLPAERDVEDEGEILEVEAFRGDLDAGEFCQVVLEQDDKEEFIDDVQQSEDWEFVGIATIKTWEESNYGAVGEAYAVWAGPPETGAWGTTLLTEATSDAEIEGAA